MSDHNTASEPKQCQGCKHRRKIELPRCPGFVPKKGAMRFIPNPDHSDEYDARMRKNYGDCYGCKHHLASGGLCLKTQCTLSYPIHDCWARDAGWA